MNLKELLNNVEYRTLRGNDQLDIREVQYDSREVKKGDVFVCIQGYVTDGHKYIDSACRNGASAIVLSEDVKHVPECTIIKVKDTRKALAVMASNYYGNPSKKMKVIGITGTNGKTTSAFMIKSILETAGYKVGLIGTISNYIGNKKIPSHRTTPESLELQKLFGKMADESVDCCVMETSSHSLYLDRTYGIKFSQAVFTNLTRDHLDFHKTFENYYKAKLILFQNTLNSVVNMDDKYGEKIYRDAPGTKVTYAVDREADVRGSGLNVHSRGINFNISYEGKTESVNLGIPGKYNAMNALGSAAACLCEGIDLRTVKKGLESMEAVPGRCEIVTRGYDLGYEVVVDFAHTPDGLQNILKTAREFTKGRLICVFGCGGDRDNTKRPIMGKIGTELSDFAVITSDNPRTEEPMSIIDEIVSGVEKHNYTVVENRREAIKKAMEMAEKGDVVVVAGKGHESYQILKDKTIHFDEREVVADIIRELTMNN